MRRAIKINLWSGPRNISTALMYSFAQRTDTTVVDEPLYAHYLKNTNAHEYHPGSEEILQTMENDGNKVVESLLSHDTSPVLFIKQMTHHLVKLDWAFMDDMVNVILTRDPVEMLPSYAEQIENPSLKDVGYAAHVEVLEYLQNKGKKVIVLDGRNVLLNPEKVLTELCAQIGIPFDPSMLSWEAMARAEDGVWAKYWYKNVHKSTGFIPYVPKTGVFPQKLQGLLDECIPYYKSLSAMAILA